MISEFVPLATMAPSFSKARLLIVPAPESVIRLVVDKSFRPGYAGNRVPGVVRQRQRTRAPAEDPRSKVASVPFNCIVALAAAVPTVMDPLLANIPAMLLTMNATWFWRGDEVQCGAPIHRL